MTYLYAFILFTLITLIICFRNYKKEFFNAFPKKEAPLRFVYGFAMLIIGKHSASKNLNKLLQSISLGICAFTILITFGLAYSLSNTTKATDVSLEATKLDITSSLPSPESTVPYEEPSSISGINNEDYITLKNTIKLFEKYREDIENEFLGDNESYLSISKPLNLITEYGEEHIQVSWSFETDGIIDDKGNIIFDNIGDTGCSTLAYATLTLGDTSATLTIPICISPP